MEIQDMTEGTAAGTDPAEAFMAGSVRTLLGLDAEDIGVALAMARRSMERGAFAEAMQHYALMVLCDPKRADVQVGLANCAMQMEAYDLALQAASVAVALTPRDPRGYYLSGRACLGLGLQDEAREDFLEAIGLGIEARAATIVEGARKLLAALAPAAPRRAIDS